jgi:acetylornithine deacetylase
MTTVPALLEQLVAINSINPTLAGGPGEEELARWAGHWLSNRGLHVQLQEAQPGRLNVIARVAGRGETPSLLLNAHLDTVGVEGMTAPFALREEDDRLYGRGAYDMKGSIAIMLHLAARLEVEPPPGDVWLTLSCDEEDRSIGSDAIVRDWLPSLDTPLAAAIVLEPSEEQIGIAHKGFAWFELDISGRAAHGSRPEEGIDAILPLGEALGELASLEAAFQGGEHHPLLGRPSLHASTIEGGTAWSVYPASARLRWERRTLPGEDEPLLARELERVAGAARDFSPARVDAQCIFTRQPLETPSDAAIVRALQSAAPEATLTGLAFWTDGALFSSAGIPTVIYGPTGHGAHADDEWVSAASLERVTNVVHAVIRQGVY